MSHQAFSLTIGMKCGCWEGDGQATGMKRNQHKYHKKGMWRQMQNHPHRSHSRSYSCSPVTWQALARLLAQGFQKERGSQPVDPTILCEKPVRNA